MSREQQLERENAELRRQLRRQQSDCDHPRSHCIRGSTEQYRTMKCNICGYEWEDRQG